MKLTSPEIRQRVACLQIFGEKAGTSREIIRRILMFHDDPGNFARNPLTKLGRAFDQRLVNSRGLRLDRAMIFHSLPLMLLRISRTCLECWTCRPKSGDIRMFQSKGSSVHCLHLGLCTLIQIGRVEIVSLRRQNSDDVKVR
jgi:hypothetical protein